LRDGRFDRDCEYGPLGELDGVAAEIDQHLLDPQRVADQGDRAYRPARRSGNPGLSHWR
jgi:hypothetical protein